MQRLRAWVRALVTLGGSPYGIAGGFSLGLSLSLVPVPGLGMVVALALAPVLRMNLPATYLGTAVVNPVTGAAFYFAELWVGMIATGRSPPSWAELSQLDAMGWWRLSTELVGPFLIGAALCMAAAVVITYPLLHLATRRWQAARRRHGDDAAS